MFGNFRIADLIAYECSKIDNKCRRELQRGILVSERDYVTALSTRIRDEMAETLGIPCHSQTVRPAIENENGVDGIIVFKWGNEVKVGLFEAKRPQITINNYRWDYLTVRNTSHFSEQIENQHKWRGVLALWEMFFNEGVSGFLSPPFDYFGSSCVWHKNAYEFMNSEGLIFNQWNTQKLNALLEKSCVNFYSVIFDIVSCKAGSKIAVDQKNQTVTVSSPSNNNVRINIPLPIEIGLEQDERIRNFMLENGLESYTFLELDRLIKQ